MPTFWPSIPDELREFIVKQPVFFVASAPSTGKHINVSPKGHPSRTFAVLGPNQVAYIDTGGSGAETVAHIYENGRVTMMFCSFVATPRIVRLFCRGRVVERGTPEFRPLIEKMAAAGMQVERPDPKLVARMEKYGMAGSRTGSSGSESGDEEEAGKKSRRPHDIDLRSTDGAGLIGSRCVIVLDVWKVQKSCGFGVPLLKMDPDGALAEGTDKPSAQAGEGKDAAACEPKPKPAAKKKADDVYDNTSCNFDGAWDNRTVLTNWVSKRVQGGELMDYRLANNTLSLDGLPALHMCRTGVTTTARQHLSAWTARTFLGQWQAVLAGFMLALIMLAFGVQTERVILNI